MDVGGMRKARAERAKYEAKGRVDGRVYDALQSTTGLSMRGAGAGVSDRKSEHLETR